MGYDLVFDVRGEAEPVPGHFSNRYSGRQKFVGLIWDIEHDEVQDCSCDLSVDGKHDYFCGDIESVRPKDFQKFRERLKAEGLLENGDGSPSVFAEMADYLERNPNVYMNGGW